MAVYTVIETMRLRERGIRQDTEVVGDFYVAAGSVVQDGNIGMRSWYGNGGVPVRRGLWLYLVASN